MSLLKATCSEVVGGCVPLGSIVAELDLGGGRAGMPAVAANSGGGGLGGLAVSVLVGWEGCVGEDC